QLDRWVAAAHEAGALVVVAADLLALTLLEAPGTWGADVVVGTTQRFGVPMGFGGPHAGYLAVREGLQRQLPGRLVGVSKDADGLRAIAARVHGHARRLAAALADVGLEVVSDRFFDTVTVRTDAAEAFVAAALARNITLWRAADDTVSIACDELTTDDVVRALVAAAREAMGEPGSGDAVELPDVATDVPADLARTTDYLTHPVFSSHRSETAMMRYLRRLS